MIKTCFNITLVTLCENFNEKYDNSAKKAKKWEKMKFKKENEKGETLKKGADNLKILRYTSTLVY